MAFSDIRYNIILNAKNIPGWRTRRKIVIIECDDWGGIRIPSKAVYEKLLRAGLPLSKNRYRFDTLATQDDLELLFTVLESVKDKNGHRAVMTPVSNMANPDFEKIKQNRFREYYYEKFTDTLLKYGRGEGVFKLWRQGIEAGIFIPELHGRDHLTVQIWLQKLREGNKNLLLAFDNGLVAMNVPGLHNAMREFRPEFYFDTEDQKPFLKNAIKEGVSLFREIFNYTPRVFVPSNGIFHPDFEESVSETGVKFLYVSHSSPIPDGKGAIIYKFHIPGQKQINGLTYYTRNCAFEPTDDNYKGIELTLKQVASAFRWGKPANISTHRANFVSGIDPANRERGLKELERILKAIVQFWPDVEFMCAGDALELMKNSN